MARKIRRSEEKIRLGDLLSDTFAGEWGAETGEMLTPVLRTANFNEDGSFDYESPALRCIPDNKIKKKRMFRGDVILEKSGGTPKRPVGLMAFFDSDELMLCSNFNQVLRFDGNKIQPEFAFYQLRWLREKGAFARYTRKTTGLQNIQMKKFVDLRLWVPSTVQQSEVVASLNAIVEGKSLLQKEISYFDALVKSRFVEMFGDPIEDSRWDTVSLKDLCSKLGSGATPRGGEASYKKQGIPFIRSMNVHNGAFEWKDLAYIDDQQASKLKGVTLEKGDVLLNITGASVARSCLLPDELAGGRVNQHVAIIRADSSRLLPCVLNETLINNSYQNFLLMSSRAAGATREAITKNKLQEMRVPLLPMRLQEEFADFVHQVDKSKSIAQKQIDKLQMLYDSLAQEYFGD